MSTVVPELNISTLSVETLPSIPIPSATVGISTQAMLPISTAVCSVPVGLTSYNEQCGISVNSEDINQWGHLVIPSESSSQQKDEQKPSVTPPEHLFGPATKQAIVTECVTIVPTLPVIEQLITDTREKQGEPPSGLVQHSKYDADVLLKTNTNTNTKVKQGITLPLPYIPKKGITLPMPLLADGKTFVGCPSLLAYHATKSSRATRLSAVRFKYR